MGGGSIDTSGITTSYLDVPYANASETQKLDIYLPNEGDGLFPVIIVFHGGGFMMGSKTGGDISAMFESLDHGFAVVSVDYRLSGEAIFPAAIQDAKAAIRFIRANAAEYNLNPDKIALWGDSAGGNIASIAGTTGGTNDLYDTSLGYADVSDDVTAVVDWFGPINFLKMDEQFEASGVARATGTTNSESSPESKYIGQLITQASDLVAEANPESYITKDDPAFLIQHGTVDGNVPTQQSIDFAAALQSVLGSDKVQLTLLDGAGHGGTQFESAENLDLVFAFLDQSMK
ncbi:MAG: alpha/beta hydrolase [Clostridia bacterium]|nr:alpha/beta hydrolase [Clostridia bacterium]